jgi:mannose-6-phosphate isomerase-like protein (cupin superfamily)
MRLLVAIAFVLTMFGTAVAQQPAAQTAAPAVKTFTSAAEVQSLIAKAAAERKPGQATVAEPILLLPPYNLHLEYRASVGPAAVHETEAEIFYVLDGSATMVTGGKLVHETRTNAENLSGTAIEGGDSRAIAKGDFIMVPENTPHWFSAINTTLVLMSVHVPHPVDGAARLVPAAR